MNRDQIEDSPLSLCLLDGEGEERHILLLISLSPLTIPEMCLSSELYQFSHHHSL